MPDAKVVVTGDLLVSPTPYGYGCHPAEWIATLDVLMATDATVIVPGHGPVMHDWSYAKKVTAVLAGVRRQVERGETGRDARADPGARGPRGSRRGSSPATTSRGGAAFDDFFVRSAVDRAFQEARGEMAEE